MVLTHTDSYKLSHKGFMDKNTTMIYSNLTPRSNKHFPIPDVDEVVVFGIQAFIQEYLVEGWNQEFFDKPKEQVIAKFKRTIDAYLGKGAVEYDHFAELHDLGYLPLIIKALPEGTISSIGVPIMTIRNTHPRFAWLTNYLETVISAELWKPVTTATLIRQFRLAVNKYAKITTGSLDGTDFQLHDFSFRGMSGRHDARINSAAFLLSSRGTDSVHAIDFIEKYYHTSPEDDFIGTSVPASEHSVACLDYALRGELESYRKWLTEDYPSGIVSLVSDTTDYWKVLTEYLPELKEDILGRDTDAAGLCKTVIRPDSGDPFRIICGYFEDELFKDGTLVSGKKEVTEAEVKGTVELLWDTFGGHVNDQGYKVLNSKIGVIYGDSITYPILNKILYGLTRKGFATTNIVFGIGSYTMNFLTRDSLGMAIKATCAIVDQALIPICKNPLTDDGVKKSAKGLLQVAEANGKTVLWDNVPWEEERAGLLERVFVNGRTSNEQSFTDIRARLWEE